ncbi:hypothetical protein CHH83_01730 [Bacillus sp. 7586-K]|nr:hypothetical protein CHH83_01730 [Bacillus sp. 7586-K]
MWIDRELQSKQVLESDLNDQEKELIKLYVNSAIKERLNPNNRWQYFDGIQTGIAQSLKLLNRSDIWNLIDYEFSYHDELG